jgi:hypothetical protein
VIAATSFDPIASVFADNYDLHFGTRDPVGTPFLI